MFASDFLLIGGTGRRAPLESAAPRSAIANYDVGAPVALIGGSGRATATLPVFARKSTYADHFAGFIIGGTGKRPTSAASAATAAGGAPGATTRAPLAQPLAGHALTRPPNVIAALNTLLAARGALHETRDANAALDQAGVGDLWNTLGGDEMAAVIRALTEHIGAHGRDPVWNRYVDCCIDKGVPYSPITRASVAVFLSHYVFVKRNKSSSLPKLLSALRCYTRLIAPEAWMSAQEEALAKLDIINIQKVAPATLDPTVSLSCDQLLAAVRVAHADHSARGRLAAALLTVLPGLQARGEEVFGTGTLTFEDLSFELHGLCVDQFLGKSDKRFIRPRPKAALHWPEALTDLCATRALRRHLTSDSQWHPDWAKHPVRRHWPVFSVLKRCGATGAWTCSSSPLTTSAAKAIILDYLGRAAIVDPGLDIHFGRPTGSDLYEFYLRMVYDMVEALGGWAPTTTLSAFYQRHTAPRLAELAMTMTRERFPAGTRFCCDG